MNEKILEILEQYIQLAIDNWYKEKIFDWELTLMEALKDWGEEYIIKYETYLPVITSKEFIESIANSFIRDDNIRNKDGDKKDYLYYINWYWSFENEILDDITVDQAKAIRDNELPEFINNLLT